MDQPGTRIQWGQALVVLSMIVLSWWMATQWTAYRDFGLNDRQIAIIARAASKREYYCQTQRGNRLFELGLGPVALALCAASGKDDHRLIDSVLAEHGRGGFLPAWLEARGVAWAADLLREGDVS